jgi:hypothetical protein
MKPFVINLGALALVVSLAAGVGAARPEPTSAQRAKSAPARLSPAELPAGRDGSAILTTPAPGRYSIRVKSPSGARIELVDMIEGPTDSSGAPGLRDGRIDALFDKGAYKIRVANAKGAGGKALLSAEPFVEVDDKSPALVAGQIQSGELGDLRQRSYTLDVGPEGRVAIEAEGRALADMRLWRPGGELVDLAFERRNVEPKPGQFMTLIRLEGALAPGRYLVTAYGGEPLVWASGATAQPFLLRLENWTSLDAGLFEGVIGSFGSLRFAAPAGYDAFRLEAPQPAPVRLQALRGASMARSGAIAKNSRNPFVTLDLASDGKEPAKLEVSGYEGQAFSLRAVRRDAHFSFEGSGPHLVGLDVAGEGGDEIAATALFARVEKDGKTRVLASDMPRLANGRPWRGKFNLRGRTTLLFEVLDAGPVAIDARGVKLAATIEPTFGALAPRADGKIPSHYDLAAGFYTLVLDPIGDAAGVVDVTLGTPGVAAAAPVQAPARVAISFGEQRLERDGSYLIIANVAPELLVGPRVVALPANLEKAPLPLWQGADETISIPLRTPKNGKIVAHDGRGGDVALTFGPETLDNATFVKTVKIAPSGKARALGLAFVPDGAAKTEDKEEAKDADKEKQEGTNSPPNPSKPPPGRAPLVAAAGRASYFDLARDETRELRFDVAQGGLYRVETLGRLQTAIKIGAAVSTNLGAGENNGPGHNGLVTTYLRAGAYRAAVTAKESSGRLGFSATPATLIETPKLVDEGSARATLAPGKGASVPLEITQDGLYTIDLLGVGRRWRARLEDSEGWPLGKPGETRLLTRQFEKGAYRLVVSPEDVEARMAARLRRFKPLQELAGHGPHRLPFEAPQKLQWREPSAQGAARDPDVWRFSLQGDADVALSITDGMTADVLRGDKESVGKAAVGRDFQGRLGAGDYRVEARAISRDDRLDYEISLKSKELQPGVQRFVDLPAKVAFSLARDAAVDLTSFGDKETLGVLKDSGGAAVEQLTGRADDWNIALSRRLPAGAYTLELAALGASPQSAPSDGEDSSVDNSEAKNDDSGNQTELRLALPAEIDDGALAATGSKTLTGAGAHVLALPAARAGSLELALARSSSEIALSIERRDADGAWKVVGSRRGLAPFAAWPAPDSDKSASDKSSFRAVVWSVGGAKAPIEIAARAVERRGQGRAEIALDPVEGAPAPICVGLAELPAASVVEIAAASAGLFTGSSPGQLLRDARAGALAPQSLNLWFVAPGDCKTGVAVKSLEWRGEQIALDLAGGERAELPTLAPPKGKARLWLAESAQGRVGLIAGAGMAVSRDATLALVGDAPPRLWNASGAGPLRLSLRAIDVDVAPVAQGGALFRAAIPPLTAQPVTLATNDAPLALELPAEVAAFAAPGEASDFAIYGGASPLAATYHGAPPNGGGFWLVNLSSTPAPVLAAPAPGKRETASTTHALKGFFGAAGEIVVPVDGAKGDRLVSLGGETRFVSRSGSVSSGATIEIDGPGVALLDHSPGLAALWLERAGKGPWPAAAAKPLSPPGHVALEGSAASFALHQDAPVLLTARADAPAIVAFTQNGRRDVLAFPSGVELRRLMTAGDATLDVYSPHDGPLTGALDVFTSPVIEAHEGVNDAVTLAPGAAALFAFETKREAEIGLGLRAEPDRATMRLLRADGQPLGDGLEQSRKLPVGRYLVEARIPADAPLSVVRLAVLGLSPPPAGPPDEVVADFLEKAGLKKAKTR